MTNRRFRVLVPGAPKRRPDETQLNVDIGTDLARELDEYVAENGVLRKLVVSLSLRRFLMVEKAERAKARMMGMPA